MLEEARRSGSERNGDEEAARRRRHCWPDMINAAGHEQRREERNWEMREGLWLRELIHGDRNARCDARALPAGK